MKNKIESLQGLRGIGFLLIFLYHSEVLSSGGTIGVILFFVLSGFLLSVGNEKELDVSVKACGKYAINKIKKLYWLHLVMSVFAIPLLIHRYFGNQGWLISILLRIVVNSLLLQSFIPVESIKYSLNNLSWFLSCMLFLYFIYPLINLKLKGIKSEKKLLLVLAGTWLIMISVALILYFFCVYRFDNEELYRLITYNFPIFRAFDFTMGCILGRIITIHPLKYSPQFSSLLETLLILFFVFTSVINWNEKFNSVYWIGNNIFFRVLVLSVVVVFYYNKGIISKIIGKGILKSLGDISAYTYLIHEVVLRYLRYLLSYLLGDSLIGAGIYKIILVFLGLLITILCSRIWIKVNRHISHAQC
ncbi:MAG: acyltransferase family protein [Lachnospiraceae bacterium]|nr:acyltransferase family protein [Lachnospiraceae bacterium]